MGRLVQGSEDGQVLPLVAVALALIGFATLHVARVGAAAVSRAQAQSAADAAALAGAAEGRSAADALARQNGARLVSYDAEGDEVQVEVELGRAHATARAERTEAGDRAAEGSATGLAPAMRAALARAADLLGMPVPITSGFRSRAEQAALYARRGSNPYPVAPPGASLHERGLAVDVPRAFIPRLLAVAPRAGLCQPFPRQDPVHFELCRGR